jgi:biofilm PGA synthesis N-glycosyltransferase PgaC
MELIDAVFLMYTFLGIYMISLFLFIYIPNRKKIFEYPKSFPELATIIIPCYNEGETVGETIKHILNMKYPRDMIEIIIVDDCSSDNSWQIIQSYAKRYNNIRIFKTEKNSGRAAVPRNIGIMKARGKYILTIDADSYPEKDSLNKMLGFMQQDPLVAAVTPAILTKAPKTFIQRMQHIEYDLVAFTRKLLDLIDSVYVTPGAFALYRKNALIKVGLLDEHNLTEDIEIVWRLLSKGYKVKMSLAAKAHTETPSTIKSWWKQRNRWNIGGYQTLNKYKSLIMKKGMLGNFIIPYFSVSLILGITGLAMFIYLLFKNIVTYSLFAKYSIYASASLISTTPINLSPSIINLFGIVLFIIGLIMTFFSIGMIRYIEQRERNALNILFYLIVYSFVYPFITISSLSRIIRKKYKW